MPDLHLHVNESELATILAALRYWQSHMINIEREAFPWHFKDCEPLSEAGINRLCEDLNIGHVIDDRS